MTHHAGRPCDQEVCVLGVQGGPCWLKARRCDEVRLPFVGQHQEQRVLHHVVRPPHPHGLLGNRAAHTGRPDRRVGQEVLWLQRRWKVTMGANDCWCLINVLVTDLLKILIGYRPAALISLLMSVRKKQPENPKPENPLDTLQFAYLAEWAVKDATC